MTIAAIIQALQLVVQYGLPAVIDAIDKLKQAGNPDPTVDEIKAIMDGVNPPPPNP